MSYLHIYRPHSGGIGIDKHLDLLLLAPARITPRYLKVWKPGSCVEIIVEQFVMRFGGTAAETPENLRATISPFY